MRVSCEDEPFWVHSMADGVCKLKRKLSRSLLSRFSFIGYHFEYNIHFYPQQHH